jgi:hypothetical protein
MSFSRLFAAGLMAAGTLASLRGLRRRAARERQNVHVALTVDYDDALAVAVRAPLPLDDLLAQLRAQGATHVTLPEDTLARLLAQGRLAPVVPPEPRDVPPPVGRWLYLGSAEPDLLRRVADELAVRVAHTGAQLLPGSPAVLAVAGDLSTLAELGLGFDPDVAGLLRASGLEPIPRPVAYSWADGPLIDRTLEQARLAGGQIVAFAGELILGHELHLQDTVDALARHGLTFAYFAHSRHQRGDWFIAKQRGSPAGRAGAPGASHDHGHLHDEPHDHHHAHSDREVHGEPHAHHHELVDDTPAGVPRVVLAHELTAAEMIPEDLHSAARRWALLAREAGIRLCILRAFRVVHAAERVTANALRGEGLQVDGLGRAPGPLQPEPNEVALAGLVPAGAAALAAAGLGRTPGPATLGLALAGAAAAAVAPALLDTPRNALERAYPPSYAAKLLALATAVSVPPAGAALARASRDPLAGVVLSGLAGLAGASALAWLTSGDDYARRVEPYRGYGLDLWLALAAALSAGGPREQGTAVAVAALGWLASAPAGDVLARFDAEPAHAHTHHLSAAQRALGDLGLALSPRPLRKWAALAPLGAGLAAGLRARGTGTGGAAEPLGSSTLATAADALTALGLVALLAGFRRAERPIAQTAAGVVPGWAAGALLGLAAGTLLPPLAQPSLAQPSLARPRVAGRIARRERRPATEASWRPGR